jgi:pseudouridine-5'-phosphate glycosidase
MQTNTGRRLKIDAEVAEAIAAGRPIVALESTIITHGMPAPHNVETALAVEAEVRRAGAVPATVAVLDGKVWVGVGADGVERLAAAKDPVKVSRRDLGYAVMTHAVGGTTVAATMIAAAMAGIRIFATGGIGGVHRGAANSFDISADLEELARTDVAVVCAGVKSILDIGLTLEYLETRGVPVVGYRTDRMPAFYTTESPFFVDHRLDSPAEIARLLHVRRDLGLGGGIVIANPIPEEAALDPVLIGDAIATAIADATAARITGKDTTPFLLDRVAALTGLASLDANIALIRSNAALAGAIAVAGVA